MKKLFLGSTMLVATAVAVVAHAADMPTKVLPGPVPAPPYNWSGLYVGANFGGAWASGSLSIPNNNFYGGLTEFIGGVPAGYNFQASHLLLGVEGDFDGATFSHPTLPTPTLGSVSQNWIATAAGRVGLVEDRWLLYGEVGGGWVHSNAVLNFPGVSWSGSNTSSGSLVGAGLEYGFKSQRRLAITVDHVTFKAKLDQIDHATARLRETKRGWKVWHSLHSAHSARGERPASNGAVGGSRDLGASKSLSPISVLGSVSVLF